MTKHPDTFTEINDRKLGVTTQTADARATDSDAEGVYGRHLERMQERGEIRDLKFQVRVPLGLGQAFMRIDFVYYDNHIDEWIWDDYKAKGWRRAPMYAGWRRKADFWALLGPGVLRVTTKRRGRGEYHHTDIKPKLEGEMAERAMRAMGAMALPREGAID